MIEALKSSRFFFIIPEKGQKTSQRPYRQLADFVSELGLEVYMIDVRWKKHNSLLECGLEATKKIHEIVDELHPTEINIFGFGIGAMLTAQIGYIFRANSIILCSMPLLFNEELSQFSRFKRYFLIRRIYKGRNKPSYPSRRISSKAILIYAEKERRKLEKVKNTRNAAFEDTMDVFVAKSAASLRNKKYIEAVLNETKKLLAK